MQLSTIENDFTVAATALTALLLARLLQLGLRRQFPWIVNYEFLQFLGMIAAVIFGTSSVLYARVFEYACLPCLLATLLVAHELMSYLYAKHPGLRVFNQRSVRSGVMMAFVAAIPSALSTHARWHDPNFACMLWVFMEAMRITETGVVVYIVHLLMVSKRRKVRFPRNFALLGTALLSTFILDATGSTILSALRLHGAAVYALNITSLAVTTIVTAILTLCLQPLNAPESSAATHDETVFSRLNALEQVVATCTRNLLR
jgi:hypothetical protein